MKKLSFSLILFGVFSSTLLAQVETFKFSNARDFDEKRYQNIDASPYYFEDWVKATIYGADMSIYKDVLLNYNGYSESFEATDGKQWIEMKIDWYRRIEIKKEGNEKAFGKMKSDKVVFQRIIYPNFPDKFAIVWYEGADVQLIQEWRVALEQKTIETPGQTKQIDRFAPKKNYYLFKGDKMKLVKMKKKQLFQALGKAKQLEAFAKSEKIKIDSKEGVEKLLQYYETL